MSENGLSTLKLNINNRDRHFTECTTIGGVIIPLIKMQKLDLYLYGVSSSAFNFVLFFQDQGVQVKGLIDQDEKKKGLVISGGVPYIHISEISDKIKNPENAFVVIGARSFKGMDQVKILQNLIHAGVDKIYTLDKFEIDQIYGTGTEWNPCKRGYFVENIDKMQEIYDMLGDEKSRQIMTEYIRAHVQCGIYSLPNLPTSCKYFYDSSTNCEPTPLYKQLDNEVWINCGANTGDTIFQFFANGLIAKKIYAFEGDSIVYRRLLNALSFLPDKYLDVVKTVNEYITLNTSFREYIDERVTLINADLDCHEMEMLQAISDIIKKDRPVLAICIYHKAEDMMTIPKFISSLVDDYCYLLRKYDANVFNASRTNELVLYAIPNERKLLQD